MADSPNTPAPQSNIDDLVKELSRPQGGISSAPSQPSMSGSMPRPTMPPSVQSSPITPKPTVPPLTPRPNPVPAPSTPPAVPSAPKEYQSSIRTMSDDLAKLKAGQVPTGVNIPRKIASIPPPAPVTPPGTVPAVPAEKSSTSVLSPSAPARKLPQVPGQPPAPSAITPPTPPATSSLAPASKSAAIKPDQKSQFYVPPTAPASGGGGSRNIIFIGIAAVAVVLGGLYWYFMIYSSSPQEAIESPIATFTPRPTATPNPDPLGAIFSTRGGTIVLPQTGNPSSAFIGALAAQPGVTAGSFTVIEVVGGVASASAPQALTITGLLERFAAPYPIELKTALGENYKLLLYGQKESFDTRGRVVVNATASRRFAMVSEISNSALPILQSWEPTMAANLAGIMGITPTKNKALFLGTDYHGVSVRFMNFPYPDHSIDYALMQYNGKTYLLLAGSREAMFAAIDAFAVPVLQ